MNWQAENQKRFMFDLQVSKVREPNHNLKDKYTCIRMAMKVTDIKITSYR